MRAHSLMPGLVLVSSARRAQQTVKLWQKSSDYEGPIQTQRRLYLAEPATYLEALAELDSSVDPVLCIGHNPGLEQLIAMLTGRHEPMPTAALAQIRVPISGWGEIGNAKNCELVNVWRVRALDAGSQTPES